MNIEPEFDLDFSESDSMENSSSLQTPHMDSIYSMTWSAHGDMLLTSCKDRIIRIYDPRSNPHLPVQVYII